MGRVRENSPSDMMKSSGMFLSSGITGSRRGEGSGVYGQAIEVDFFLTIALDLSPLLTAVLEVGG